MEQLNKTHQASNLFENTSCHSLVFCFASIVLSFDNDLKWTATEGCPACETRSCSAACVQAQHWLEIFFFEFNVRVAVLVSGQFFGVKYPSASRERYL